MIRISNTTERFGEIKEHVESFATLIGYLNTRTGIKYMEPCEVGHPVYEIDDRYILFMKSEVELRERMFDPVLGGDRTYIGRFLTAVPYYKTTLSPLINFI